MKAVLESKRDFFPSTFEPSEEFACKEIIMQRGNDRTKTGC